MLQGGLVFDVSDARVSSNGQQTFRQVHVQGMDGMAQRLEIAVGACIDVMPLSDQILYSDLVVSDQGVEQFLEFWLFFLSADQFVQSVPRSPFRSFVFVKDDKHTMLVFPCTFDCENQIGK